MAKRGWVPDSGSHPQMCSNPSWPSEDIPPKACLTGLLGCSYLCRLCRALHYSRCSENFIKPLVVPLSVI